ncbi:MAG TPA: hypothetical protein GXZ70_03230 [Clostridiales bacterium]|nr:hypothetical protein [Clostridiales bacterium]
MTELEVLVELLGVYQMVTGESGTMPEDIELQTQTLLEVKETMLQIQEQNAKMYVTVGLMQAVIFATCTIMIVRGWLHGSRN